MYARMPLPHDKVANLATPLALELLLPAHTLTLVKLVP